MRFFFFVIHLKLLCKVKHSIQIGAGEATISTAIDLFVTRVQKSTIDKLPMMKYGQFLSIICCVCTHCSAEGHSDNTGL